MDKTIKIVLALLLVLCLIEMPYGFYQLVRFISMVAFAYLAYLSYNDGNTTGAAIYFILALLFQPLIKISLGRELWNVVDVIVSIYLLISISRTPKNITNKNEK